MEIRRALPSGQPTGVGSRIEPAVPARSSPDVSSDKTGEKSLRKDFRDVLWVALPKLLGGALRVAFNILLLRYLGPKSFGTVAVCLATVMLCDSIFGSAIDMSIFRLAPLYRLNNPFAALQIQKMGLLIKPAGALLAAVPIALFAPRLSLALFQTPENSSLLYLTLAALLGTLLIRSTQVHFQIEREFRPYGLTDLTSNGFCFGLLGALLVAEIYAPSAIVAVYAFVPIVLSVAILATRARPIVLVPASSVALHLLVRTLKWLLPTVIVGSVLSRMDLFFVSGFAGVNEAGIYSAAQVFALLPALLGLYMSAVFSPRVMPLWREGKLKPIYVRHQVGLVIVAVLGYLLTVLFLNRITGVLLPESFRRSNGVILALLPVGLSSFLSFPWTIPLLLYLRPKLLLLLDCVAVLALTPVFIAVARHGGAMGVAKLTSALMILRALIHQWLAWRTLDLRTAEAIGPEEEFAGGNLHSLRTI